MPKHYFADDYDITGNTLTIWYYDERTDEDYEEWKSLLTEFFDYCEQNQLNEIMIETFRPEQGEHHQKIIKIDNFTWWLTLEIREKLGLLTGFLRKQLAKQPSIIYIELRLQKKAG